MCVFSRTNSRDYCGLLADGMGTEITHRRHVDQNRGEGAGECVMGRVRVWR